MSEPPAPKAPELEGGGRDLRPRSIPPDAHDMRPLAPPRPARAMTPRPVMPSPPSIGVGPTDTAPEPSITAMPIISLGTAPSAGSDAVEVASRGIRRSTIPPGILSHAERKPSARPPDLDPNDETTLPRARPPAESLVDTVPNPRPPLKSDPHLARPAFGDTAAGGSAPMIETSSVAGADVDVQVEAEDGAEDPFDVDDATESEPPPDTDVEPPSDVLRADDVIESASYPVIEPPPDITSGRAEDVEPQPDSGPRPAVASVPAPAKAGVAPPPSATAPLSATAAAVPPPPASLVAPAAPAATPPASASARPPPPAAVLASPSVAQPAESEPGPETPRTRISEIPPEVDPEDMEISEAAPPASAGPPRSAPLKQPPPPVKPQGGASSVPLPVRGAAALAAAVQAQHSAEPISIKRARYWWDELFGDDFLRTMDRLTDSQIKNEVTFIEESLAIQKGGVVLDLACGAGRHAVEMALRGYNVVGYDLSLAMLARAADEAHDRKQKLNFLHGDMRDMGFEEMFDGVYCWSTSFGYFDDEKNLLVAQRIHRALRSGGMLLLDVANRDFVTQRQPSLVWFEGEGCVCMDEMRVDFITSRLKVKRMVILDDGRTREMDYSIRLYTLHELGRLLHDVGFKVTDVSGHPATPGVFMGADSPRLIVLAEKA